MENQQPHRQYFLPDFRRADRFQLMAGSTGPDTYNVAPRHPVQLRFNMASAEKITPDYTLN